jgi:hypothetical protein
MNRREWLKRAAMGAALLVTDPEELLWTPTKKIFIPPARGFQGICWDGEEIFFDPYASEYFWDNDQSRLIKLALERYGAALAV